MSSRPSTSSQALFDQLTALGLDVELAATASPDPDGVLAQLSDWYSEPERATAAQVFALTFAADATTDDVVSSPEFAALRVALARWLERPLPKLQGDELIEYVADALLIASAHSADPDGAPWLFCLQTPRGELFLLRPPRQRPASRDDWLSISTRNSPDTEAALSGIFRYEGCSPAFAEHAPGCPHCMDQLRDWDMRVGLPEGWERLRAWAAPVREVSRHLPLPPRKPESGVGIVILRPPEPLPRPWWRFWS